MSVKDGKKKKFMNCVTFLLILIHTENQLYVVAGVLSMCVFLFVAGVV